MRISGEKLQQYAQRSQQAPTQKQAIRIYQKRNGSYDVEVFKKKKNLAGLVQKLALKVKHRKDTKMHASFTSKVLFKAAVLQEAAKKGEYANPEMVKKAPSVDQVAYELIQTVNEQTESNGPAPDLVEASKHYDTSHEHKLHHELPLVTDLIGARQLDRIEHAMSDIQSDVTEIFDGLEDNSIEMAETPAPNGASGLMKTAEGILSKTETTMVGKAMSDTWRSVDKVVIMGPDGQIVFDGPDLARRARARREGAVLNFAADLLAANKDNPEANPLPEGFAVRSMEQFENPSLYQPPQLQLAAFIEQQQREALTRAVEKEAHEIVSGETDPPEDLAGLPEDLSELDEAQMDTLKQHLTVRKEKEIADAAKLAEDTERGQRAKDLLGHMADQAPELSPTQRLEFKKSLVECGSWTTNSVAAHWADAWIGGAGRDHHPVFIKRLRALSQDHSTGLFVHATRLKHTASARERGVRLNEETKDKKFTYRFKPGGVMLMGITQQYEAMHRSADSHSDVTETKVADLKLNGVWSFGPEMQVQQCGYRAANLQFCAEDRDATNRKPQEGLHKAAENSLRKAEE